jgi:transposase
MAADPLRAVRHRDQDPARSPRRGDGSSRRSLGEPAGSEACAGTCHVSAYPRECTETFQAAHVAAFSFFGGVPTKTAYDNTSIAVARIIGRERALTREFLRLESHYLFTHRFCRVGRGNEKGHVEGLVGYGRRNFMVPVPSCSTFAELNARLRERCRADLDRRVGASP